MAIITNLTRFIEELNAQRMLPGEGPTTMDELDTDCDMLQEVEPEEGEEEDWSIDEDLASNFPCDFSGFCAGTGCPRFFECQGEK